MSFHSGDDELPRLQAEQERLAGMAVAISSPYSGDDELLRSQAAQAAQEWLAGGGIRLPHGVRVPLS